MLDNPLVIFYSDKVYLGGEHRFLHKNHVYEEASRIPFAVRYPPLVAAPRVEDRLIQVIDLAPTIYELAGIAQPSGVDGRSLVPLLRGTSDWRDAILLEGWPDIKNGDDPSTSDEPAAETDAQKKEQMHYQAIRTAQYVYVITDNDSDELYDTMADPYQITNLVNDPKHKRILRILRKRLK